MGRHHQQSSRRGYGAHVALGAATLAAMVGGGGVAVALQAAPASAVPTITPAAATPLVAPVATPAAPVTTTPARTSARKPAARTTTRPAAICDLSGPPEFGDPARPNVITNRSCGYVDAQGRERSRDPWIDDQLLDAAH